MWSSLIAVVDVVVVACCCPKVLEGCKDCATRPDGRELVLWSLGATQNLTSEIARAYKGLAALPQLFGFTI